MVTTKNLVAKLYVEVEVNSRTRPHAVIFARKFIGLRNLAHPNSGSPLDRPNLKRIFDLSTRVSHLGVDPDFRLSQSTPVPEGWGGIFAPAPVRRCPKLIGRIPAAPYSSDVRGVIAGARLDRTCGRVLSPRVDDAAHRNSRRRGAASARSRSFCVLAKRRRLFLGVVIKMRNQRLQFWYSRQTKPIYASENSSFGKTTARIQEGGLPKPRAIRPRPHVARRPGQCRERNCVER
jgi:hypothetical protein